MKEYNLFTKKLFEQGYCFENYPDYARLPNPFCSRELFEILGGFEYTNEYLKQKVYATGCGLLYQGSKFFCGYMSYQGIDWKPENDNPVVSCPYRKENCSLRHPFLNVISGGGLVKFSQCNCHEVSIPYDYEQSGQKLLDQEARRIQEKYEAFVQQEDRHVCHWHTRYNHWTGEWQQSYNPLVCARNCQNIGRICNLSHTPLSKKRGNVFYDMKITKIRRDDTFFSGQEEISIKKGCRFLEHPTSLTICEHIVQHSKQDILQKASDYYSRQILLFGWRVEILNVRAEQRESRDLLQDLQDIQNGITVTHASDQTKREKEAKQQRRADRKEKQQQKLEKKIIEHGWQSIPTHSPDYFHAMKWFGEEKIQFLEQLHQDFLKSRQEQPQQLSLFEFMK